MNQNQVHVQQDNNLNPCVLILKDQDLPLELEIKSENEKLYNIPLTASHSSIVYYISEEQKNKLSREIHKFNKFNDFAKPDNFQQTQNFLLEKNLTNETLQKFLPSFSFGSNSLKNFESDYQFEQLISSQSTQNCDMQEYNKMSNAAVLIYDGCSVDQLISNIQQFSDFKVLVFINGREKLKQFLSSLKNQKIKLEFLNRFNEFNSKYFTSSCHTLFYSLNWDSNQEPIVLQQCQDDQIKYQNVFHLVIAPENFDYPLMLKWIYQGFFKYIDPKFAFIASSNLTFKDKTNFEQLVKFLSQNTNKSLFGLQWREEHQLKKKKNGFDLCDKLDLGINYVLIDSNFKVKRFHNPLSCLYDWQKISIFIDDYLNEISNEKDNTNINRINEVLPRLLYDQIQNELGYVSNIISTTCLKNLSEEESFHMNCLRTQNIQKQLQGGIQLSRQNTGFWYSISLFLQNILCKIFFIEQYFGLAICLFFSFQCPYQLISYILDSNVGYTALAILIPIFNGLNILFILIISTLYSVQDRFQQKNQIKQIYFKINYDRSSQSATKYDPHNYYDTCEIIQKDQNDNLKLLIKLDNNNEHIVNLENNQQQNEQYIKFGKFKKFKRINKVFNFLLQNQRALDFTIVISVITNVIISYGPQFLEPDSNYKLLVIIFALTFLFCITISKQFTIFAQAFNLSFISFISYIYILQQKIGTPEQQIINKRHLAQLLILNCLLFYIFICIESYYEYSGYILIGILGALSLIEFTKSILIILGQCNTLSNSNNKPEEMKKINYNQPLCFDSQFVQQFLDNSAKYVELSKPKINQESTQKIYFEREKIWQQNKTEIKGFFTSKILNIPKDVEEQNIKQEIPEQNIKQEIPKQNLKHKIQSNALINSNNNFQQHSLVKK